MSFSSLSSFLRLPMVALICGQLVFLGGNFSLDDYFIPSAEEVAAFDERDDTNFLDTGLPIVAFKDAFIQPDDLAFLGLGHAPGDATLELRATGPPNA